MDQTHVPQPLFAPATQEAQNDDIDMNEVFAEYFINEFDDPLDAYTGGMANYSGEAIAMGRDTAKQPPGPSSLPTGGIKTAFHANVLKQNTAKKQKIENTTIQQNNVQMIPAQPKHQMMNNTSQQHQQSITTGPQMNATPIFQSVPSLSGGSVVVGSIPAQSYSEPANHSVPEASQQLPPPTEPQQPAPPKASLPMALPVGVGIRLGGIGGIVPATHSRPPAQQYGVWAPQGLSEHALAERRQRNREHAKKSRVRKKFMLESLQEQVRALQHENNNLRLMVQEHIPEHGVRILAECCQTPAQQEDKSVQGLAGVDRALMGALSAAQQCFVLSDPKLPDNPIIFASPGFYELTGYTSKEVLGRNCRFLQGPGTDPRAVEVIRKAVATGSDATVCLLNYKADRSPFWNNFFIAALRDSDNNIVNLVGVQSEVAPERTVVDNDLEEKVNAILPLQGQDS